MPEEAEKRNRGRPPGLGTPLGLQQPTRNPAPLILDFTKEAYFPGAAFLAMLVYPTQVEAELRGRIEASIRFACRLRLLGTDEAIAVPEHEFRSPEILAEEIAFAQDRVGTRIKAGHMVIPYAVLGSGRTPRLPSGATSFSRNQIMEATLYGEEKGAATNQKARIWQPARPVFHLAAAFARLESERRKSGFNTDVLDLLQERAVVEQVVRYAIEFDDCLKAGAQVPIAKEYLVPIQTIGLSA